MTINVIQPKHGRIDVISAAQNAYTVQYVPTVGVEVDFKEFKVYCHKCEDFVVRTSQTVATFDFDYLASHGHPGPFDIYADATAEVAFLLKTRPDDANMGSTTPVEEWIDGSDGETVYITIKATPKAGYEFVEWISSTGKKFTKATQDLSVTLHYGESDYREYVAYFRPKTFKAYVTIKSRDTSGDVRLYADNSGVRPTGNPRKVRVYDRAIRQDVDVAELHNNYSDVATGAKVTFNLVMLQAASTYGVRFMGFAVVSGTREDGMFIEGSNSVTVTCDGTGIIEVEAWFSLGSIVVTLKIRNHKYGNLTSTDVYNTFLWDEVPAGTKSRISALKEDYENGEFKWAVPAETEGMYDKHLFIEWIGYITNPMAILHGTSSGRCQIGHWSASTYSRIKIIPGTQDETFYIYLCTHLLVHKPDGQNLESKPPELLYDCNMPQQS